jgi:hypothetical protein
MTVAPLVALLLLAAPTALAGASACVLDRACVTTWSAETGSCGGAGSERNVADVTVAATRYTSEAALLAETFCVRSGEQTYREIRLDATAEGALVFLGWHNDNGTCTLVVFTEGSVAGTFERRMACSSALPPNVPAVVP